MTREFYRSRGGQETDHDKIIRQGVEDLGTKRSSEQEPPTEALPFLRFVQDFPYQWINAEFEEIQKRTDTKFEEVITGPTNIFWDNEVEELGSYNLSLNLITLNPAKIEQRVKEGVFFGIPEDIYRKFLVERIITHEAVHAYAKNVCYGTEIIRQDNPSPQTKYKTQTGIHSETYSYPAGEDQLKLDKQEFKLLNEGITDWIADDLFDLLLESRGDSNNEVVNECKNLFTVQIAPYEEAKDLFCEFLYKISEDTGVDIYTAYTAFVRQYHAEGQLDKELQNWLSGLKGKRIFNKIKNGKYFQEFADISEAA